MAVISTAGAVVSPPVPAVILGIVALGWLRCAAREAVRDRARQRRVTLWADYKLHADAHRAFVEPL